MENNLTYTKNGDYLIPDLKLEETKPLGRYGRMRRDYLKEHRPVLFNAMMVSGKDVYKRQRMRSYEIFHRQPSGAHDDAGPPPGAGA